ncbi:hypothetical protein SAICODRAFT_19524 [Saitoella complicata NRRL Y-17804]|uniref:uncharacterized protein n=1 Tax=Saitoella complicata (strain BCRC 22490 / CBS 7301 / JCM 7358 / NBRC 10748 / NRRL Y-17804) TaxID=698492 RepID=UPI000867A727|nr:uncharacterized protein SAICODRAFT_19524 [Saitoella complicata NRRL Y-17804]ODQ52727.1 hypothetical protein SAICODRAFT_19524 [Saitoella complicata NRRL Y-17804]
MSNRSRARQSLGGDNTEEASIWSNTLRDLRRLPDIRARSERCAMEANKGWVRVEKGGEGMAEYVEELGRTCKDGADATRLEQRTLEEARQSLEILIALRQATESAGVQELKRKKRKVDEVVSSDSPMSKKKAKSQPEAQITVGSQVAFKPKGTSDWIQCNVIRLLGEGSKAKVDVQDPEPDDNNTLHTFRTTVSSLIFVPPTSDGLAPFPNGTMVLARYPETTTFYKAEVTGMKRDGSCKLKFEGEEEVGKETEVERRLVLEMPKEK